MVAIAALADGKRWAGISQTGKPGAKAPKPINLPNQRLDSHGLRSDKIVPKGTTTWDGKSMLPASNAWASPLLLNPKNDGTSGSPSHIDDRPSSRGSSTSSSSVGSDFLDLPSYRLPMAANYPRSTEKRSGSLQVSRFPDSFSNVLKAPLKAVGRRAATSQGRGFSLSMDDFPVLGSKNSASTSQQGQISGRWPTIASGIVATQDKQGKNQITGTGEVILSCSYEHEIISRMDYVCKGGDPIPAAKWIRGAEQAQLHDPQVPNICIPPPLLDYWHRPPDQPPDENGKSHSGEVPYGPYKHADPTGFAVESLAHRDQFALNEEALAQQDIGHGGYYPDKRDISHAHMPADCCVINQSCHVLGKVKNGHADVLEIEKQPIIKKDVALLEKIKCLNNKARNFRALNLSNLLSSLLKDSKVKHPKIIHVEEDPATKYVPFSASTSETGPVFDRLNSVSQSSSSVPTNPSNGPDKGVTVVCLSEKQVTEFSQAGKVVKSADRHSYGRSDISRNMLDGSAQDMPSCITGHGREEHSMVDSLRGVLMVDAHQDQLLSRNTSQQPHVTVADKESNWLHCEDQHSRMRYLSAQAAKQLQDAEKWISQQNTNAIAKLEELRRYQSIQSQKSNDAPPDADMYCKPKTRDDVTAKCASSVADTCCIVSADGHNAPQPVAGVKISEVSIGSSAASNTSGLSKGYNFMSSAKSTQANMMEHISLNSLSHDNSTPEHWPMENRHMHFGSWERNITDREIPADTKGVETKNHDDLLTRNKSSRRNFNSVRPAAPPVFNEKNSTEVPSMQKTHVPCIAINSSIIPAKVTSVTGLIVGNIMLDDVPLASVNREWAVLAKEVHDTASSLSGPRQVKKSEKNQHGLLPVETPISNDSVMCKPIKQTGRKEEHAEGGPHGMAVVDGFASVVQNLAKPVEYFNVADVIQESSDQWQQGDVQFESKAHGGTEDRSKLTEMVSLPGNTWEKHPATDSPRRYHVEAQRNVGIRFGYRERAGRGRFFHESPAPSRARWMPKYISHPQSDAQYDGVSEWLQDSHQLLLDMDNSQGLDSKPTQISDRDAGMDLQGGEGNVGMSFVDENPLIWNETEWEYQPLFPAPHRLGQRHGDTSGDGQRGRGRQYRQQHGDASDDGQRGRGGHSEYHYPEPVRSRDTAPDIQRNPGGADNHQYPAYSRLGMHTERRYYI
ncbi:uncharacterized protein LOC119286052 [Triticum dicoccoides]|uniref:uncharacterized protein LOC119286052 n=1 Tax=Triticum dicoccoides TaxID=85692 RepID=UPI000E79E89F|nr:uncharacterized protein LOC119286052 [Triticum dicoccoides]